MPVPRFFLKDPARLSGAQFYSLSMTSGLITLVAAGTATAGHLAVVRFDNPDGLLFHVTRFRMHWETIAGFTAAQEMALVANVLSGYSAAHSGGNAGVVLARAPGYAATSLSGRMAATGELTAGTHVIGAQLCSGRFAELAAAATLQKGFIDEQLGGDDDPHPVVALADDTGILVSNGLLMGAGGTGRLTVDLEGYQRAA